MGKRKVHNARECAEVARVEKYYRFWGSFA